jgi:hypothetical protein
VCEVGSRLRFKSKCHLELDPTIDLVAGTIAGTRKSFAWQKNAFTDDLFLGIGGLAVGFPFDTGKCRALT